MPDETERSSPKLTRQQMELVLRRAAELEQASDGGAAGGDLVPVDEIERIAAEAGLSQAALRRALTEVRAGKLAPVAAAQPLGTLDRVFGPAYVVLERSVPGPIDDVRTRTERYFRGQLMRIKRNFGDRLVWERAQGLMPRLLRAFDWSTQYAFGDGVEVESTVLEDADGRARVVFQVNLERIRRGHSQVGIGISAAAAAVTALVAYGGGGVIPLEILIPMGGGVAATSIFGTRRSYQSSLEKVRTALERFLDQLEHERG